MDDQGAGPHLGIGERRVPPIRRDVGRQVSCPYNISAVTTLQLSRSGANKPSDRKPFAVRVRVVASWHYATPRRERIKLGLAGSVQVAVFSPLRSLAKWFTTRRQALAWARWMASGYAIVEVVRLGYGPLRDRTNETTIQLHLFD